MCITPSHIPGKGPVPCHKCWQCNRNRIDDMIGRCIAESQYSTKTVAVTLTYRGDDPRAATLVYADVQNMFKKMRASKAKGGKGYSVRYLIVGEYGSKKGRAHWHGILFFKGDSPDVKIEERVDWDCWPHGFSYFQEPDYKGFKYALKYALKDQHEKVCLRKPAMSKKPLLGYEYINYLADEYVSQGQAPQNCVYRFPGVTDNKGKRTKFHLMGRSKEVFLDRFIERWEATKTKPLPRSTLLKKHMGDYDDTPGVYYPPIKDDRSWQSFLRGERPIPAIKEEKEETTVDLMPFRQVKYKRWTLRIKQNATVTVLKGAKTWQVESKEELRSVFELQGLNELRREWFIRQIDGQSRSQGWFTLPERQHTARKIKELTKLKQENPQEFDRQHEAAKSEQRQS